MEYYVNIVEIKICRVCNSAEGVLNILTDPLADEGVLLHEALEFITCLKVETDDDISKCMCVSCSTRLLDAYRFKNQALESYKAFQLTNAPTKVTFVDEHDVELHSDLLVVDTNDSTPELSNLLLASTDKPEIDMSTDAVSFLIEHHLKNSMKDKPVAEQQIIETPAVDNLSAKQNQIGKLKHECEICNRRFRKKSNLIDHLRLHANVKKFACSFCDKSFVQIANFRMHERIHTNERPYECPLCFKAYNQSSTLTIHMRSHTQERNYICSTCSKAFTNASDLNKHKRVHDPSKHFKCEFCAKNFAQKVNMKAHQRKVHAKEVNS